MKRRVVITGIAPIAAIGIGKDEFFQNLFDNKIVIEEIPEEYTKNYKFTSKYRVPAPKIDLDKIELPFLYEKLLSQGAKYALAGSYFALKDAGFEIIKKDKKYEVEGIKEAKIIFGTGLSGMGEAFNGYKAHSFGEGRFNKLSIPIIMPNSISAWTSIMFGVEGENYTINSSCASGTMAIGKAYESILRGESEIALTGGVESLSDSSGCSMRGFDVLGVLTKNDNGIPKPFDENRSGFLYCDGAAGIVVLEELNHALERKAQIYGEITNYVNNSDAYNIVQINESGEKIEELVKKLIGKEKIDYINSHGTGTELNDRIEAQVIKKIFGNKDKQPLINSSKGILGHSIGASGALEAIITAFSLKNNKVHGNILDTPIDNLNVNIDSQEVEIAKAITVSYGFGGHNAGLLLQKYEG